jgi:transcriptional regulator with XRE-family HTH domain
MRNEHNRAFNEWLRAQLKARRMSQRQLAQQSGVDHSTISRLIRGDRMPSLGTAAKLVRGLRELPDEGDLPEYLTVLGSGPVNPTARVEYALRSDDLLTEAQVRQIMEYYLAVRMRRLGRPYAGGPPQRPTPGASPRPVAGPPRSGLPTGLPRSPGSDGSPPGTPGGRRAGVSEGGPEPGRSPASRLPAL